MENVTQKILELLNQAQELIQSAKEVYAASISEPAPENLEEDVETPEVPETPENETPAETTTPAIEGNEDGEGSNTGESEGSIGEGEGSVGSQE